MLRTTQWLILVLALALPMTIWAAESDTTPATDAPWQDDITLDAEWRYPEAGISFNYPASLESVSAQGFVFTLAETDEAGQVQNFIGLQQATTAQAGGDIAFVFGQFAEAYATEIETVDVNGVETLRLAIPPDESGRQALLVGYAPSDDEIALLVFSAVGDDWERFSSLSESVLETLAIDVVVADYTEFDAQLQANLETNEVLRIGSDDAPVRMIEVLDFSCPHCVDYAASVSRVLTDYVVPGEVQYEFLMVTFVGREFSENAASAQYCSASLGFGWSLHKEMVSNYQAAGTESYGRDALLAAAGTIEGADVDAFTACFDEGQFDDLIARDIERAEELGVTSTPSILFQTGDEAPSFLEDSTGPVRGAIRLGQLYDHFDMLLAQQ